MPKNFISNYELRKLLLSATVDERLALTRIFDQDSKNPYGTITLQEKISEEGGHGITNWWRGQGTGYLDILDDIANELEIKNIPSYESGVKYYDELFYIKGEKDDTPESKVKRPFTKDKATLLGLEYAESIEKIIIVELIKKSYEFMVKQKKDYQMTLVKLQKKTSITKLDIDYKLNQWVEDDIEEELKESLEKKIKRLEDKLKRNLLKEEESKNKIKEISKQIDDFDNTINDVVKEFSSDNRGKVVGTAGIMILANLGGFATYTFLTSMMSFISVGTLGFGAYTAATSLLSIMIGPVGWAGLGLFTLFSIGKPKMSKLMPLVAVIGGIRQRIKYEK